MKNYADRGGCYPPKPKYHQTKAEFNNCFIIHSKYFQSSKNISLHNFLIGFCRFHGKITRYLKTMNKKQEKVTNKTLFKEVTNLPLEAKYE